ncbi:MAG: hypothetical protein K0S07_1602 [Chlamydiales bacterium]|jgi:AGCS family alanine or glycine:cation symporter|nr:hypothetical protein [Chlamydiales bacterium]
MAIRIFEVLMEVDTLFWGYIGFSLICLLGVYFTLQTRFFQLRAIPALMQTFLFFWRAPASAKARGLPPLRTFVASVGGMIGIGNVVGIVTAVQLGGPGALFWVWMAALIGALIKYAEIFLGLKHRVANQRGGYDGGPMYYLSHAFKSQSIAVFVSLLLCIYGTEIYQFAVITESLSANWGFNRLGASVLLLASVLYSGLGGVSRVGKICSWVIPLLTVIYLGMSLFVITHHIAELPGIIANVVSSAFNGHAAVGGFAGSSALLSIQQGVSRAVYSADVGIGSDSIIQSESKVVLPERQALLALFGVFIDNMICTLSILTVLTTGIWSSSEHIEASNLVQDALSMYFPFMDLFMPFFLVVLGYTTIIAYFCVAVKCAQFLHPKHGRTAYFIFATAMLIFFSLFDQTEALLVMSVSGSLLLMINLLGIFRLRKQVVFRASLLKRRPGAAPLKSPALYRLAFSEHSNFLKLCRSLNRRIQSLTSTSSNKF